MVIHGKCHCGNISFTLTWEPEPTEIPARACSCTFCQKHGGLWTSNPRASLTIAVDDPAHLAKYAFGTKTADFNICTRCGVVPLVTSAIDDQLYAVVSVNAFENIDPALLRRGSISFDDEAVDDRLARRKRGWIRDVRFVQRC